MAEAAPNHEHNYLPIFPGSKFSVPSDIKNLLYIVDSDGAGAWSGGFGIVISFNISSRETVEEEAENSDPSTIYTKAPISKPKSVEDVYKPGYYPSYIRLSPEQKWIYLNWLQDITQPIDIGYVFVFYYGLERQLMCGNFDLAFDTILLLRKYHMNGSFQGYSYDALLHAAIEKNRTDKINLMLSDPSKIWVRDVELKLKWDKGENLSVDMIVDIGNTIGKINRRYLKDNLDVFKESLEEALREIYGSPSFPWKELMDINELPKFTQRNFANTSLPDRFSSQTPSFLRFKPFTKEIRALFKDAHELTKKKLKALRKKPEKPDTN